MEWRRLDGGDIGTCGDPNLPAVTTLTDVQAWTDPVDGPQPFGRWSYSGRLEGGTEGCNAGEYRLYHSVYDGDGVRLTGPGTWVVFTF